jgi:hypothetical protein
VSLGSLARSHQSVHAKANDGVVGSDPENSPLTYGIVNLMEFRLTM